jgi:hypothetical protein
LFNFTGVIFKFGSFETGICKTEIYGMTDNCLAFFGVFSTFFIITFFLSLGVVGDENLIFWMPFGMEWRGDNTFLA